MKNPRHVGSPDALTIVIKLGTSSIVHEETLQPRIELLSALVQTVCTLRNRGHRVVIVSSGSIGVGLKRMSMKKRPKALPETQALAAIGQGRLIALYDTLFGMLDQTIGQVLLTRNDISDRSRYLNSVKTLTSLLSMGVVPIVNENDTVAVSEIEFGDNDTLSAITAGMVAADYLCLMTDVDCLYTENPRKNKDAKAVKIVRDIESVRKLVSTATLGSSLGTGGMETKLIAAELATGAGVSTIITNSCKPACLLNLVSPTSASSPTSTGQDVELSDVAVPYTIFLPSRADLLPDRRWWVTHGLKPRGSVYIDEGAYRAIVKHANGGRLLPAGVVKVEGEFAAGQSVRVFVVPKCNNNSSNKNKKNFHRYDSSPESSTVPTPLPELKSSESEPATSLENSISDLGLSNSATNSQPNLHLHSISNSNSADTDVDVSNAVEFGRGLSNYNFVEIDRLKRLQSSDIEKVLGYIESEHVVIEITPFNKHQT